MNQNNFLTKTAQSLVFLLLGCLLFSVATAWCAGGKNPNLGDSKAAVAAVKEVKADKKLKPLAKAGKVQHTLASLSNQDLLALLHETRMEMPVYQHLQRMRPAAKSKGGPGAGTMSSGPAGSMPTPVGEPQVRQVLETALNKPNDRQFIISMLSNYLLNNPAY